MHLSNIDVKLQKIVSPNQICQVVMIRGLCNPWKQLVFYNFDMAMNKDILMNIIDELYEAGFMVVAITSDMGLNMTIWKNLNIGLETHFNNISELFFHSSKIKQKNICRFLSSIETD